MSEQIFCKYCKGSIIESLEQEQGYHESCFQEMIKQHPDLAVLEPLVTQDRMLVESLLQMRKEIPLTVTQLDNSIELGWGYTRSAYLLKIQLTTTSDHLQKIKAITLLHDIGQIYFDFTMADQPKISLQELLDFESHVIKRIASYEWFFIYTIFDTIIIRYLREHLPTSEFEYLQSVKAIINLPIYAFNHQFIFFSDHDFETGFDQPFFRLELAKNYTIIGMTTYSFNQELTEQLLCLKREYFHSLTLSITHVDNPGTLYQKFSNFDRIDHLFLTISFLGGKERWPNHVFDYSSVAHLQLQSLGFWMISDRPERNAEMINYPKQASLELLILNGFELPLIQAWTIKRLILERNQEFSYPTQFDNLPENLGELKLSYYSVIENSNYICTKTHPNITKIVFSYFSNRQVSKEDILEINGIKENFLSYFPQAEIEVKKERVRRSYIPLSRGLGTKDWYFSISDI